MAAAVGHRTDLPDLEVSGWKVGTEGIEYEWTSGDIVPQELIDILCAYGDEREMKLTKIGIK